MADEELLKSLEDIRNYGRDYIRDNPESGFLTGPATSALRGMPTSTAGMLPEYMNLLPHKEGTDWSETNRLERNNLSIEALLNMLRQGSITEEQLEQDIGREDSYGPYAGGRGEAPERRAVIKSALAIFRREKARAANSLNESRFQGTSPDQNLRTWDEAFQADQDIAQKTHEVPPLMEGSFQAMDEDRYDPLTYLEMFDRAPYGEATPDMLPREARQPYQTAPNWGGYDLGGLVTPAGPGTFPQTASETMMAMGGSPSSGPSSDAQALIQELEAVRRSGTVSQIRKFLSDNMASLLTVASQDPDFANRLESITGSMPRGGGGELLAPPGPMGRPVGEYQIYDDPATSASPVGTNEADAWAGMGSSFPGPSFRPWKGTGPSGLREYEVLDQTAPDYEALEEARGPMSEFAHGGYVHGRGTMPGELHRRGSLPVRVAGESMGEYRKHREDEDDVRPVRRTLDNALSPTLSRRIFG